MNCNLQLESLLSDIAPVVVRFINYEAYHHELALLDVMAHSVLHEHKVTWWINGGILSGQLALITINS